MYHSGVIDQEIQATGIVSDVFKHGPYLFIVMMVAGHRHAAAALSVHFRNSLSQFRRTTARDIDGKPGSAQCSCNTTTESSAGTGYDRDALIHATVPT
jgi:hypothetical protein